jgi:hypothetical protein
MNHAPNPAIVAAALHRVFDASPHAFNSFELWMDIAVEAALQLVHPEPAPPQWLPLHLMYRKDRTDGMFHTTTRVLKVTTGPLAGGTYNDLESAALAVVTRYPGNLHTAAPVDLPTWKLDRAGYAPDSQPQAHPASAS